MPISEPPWTLGDAHDCGPGYAICSGPQVIARVVGFGYPTGKGRHPTSDANARALVRAPRLIEVLRLITDEFESRLDGIDNATDDEVEAVAQARSLLHELDA